MLNRCQVEPEKVITIVANTNRDGKGSSVDVLLRDAADATQIRLGVRSFGVKYTGDRVAWCDIKKGRRAADRARRLHRLAEIVEDLEADHTPALQVRKRMANGILTVDGNRAAYVTNNSVVFTAWAQNRYSDEQRATAMGYAVM